MSTNLAGPRRLAGAGLPVLRRALVVALPALLLGACDGSPSGPDAEPAVAAVEVTPENLDLEVGEDLDLQAVPYSSTGVPLLGRTIVWSTRDASVVAVSPTGRITGVGPGVADVHAKAGGVTGTSTVRVLDPSAPLPEITGLLPASVPAGSPAFDLVVTGSGFAPGSRVLWGGDSRHTTRVGPGELRVRILRTDVEEAGTADVVVENPPFGGPASEPTTFTVTPPASGVATITALEPATLPAGSEAFTLTVRGLGFRPGATLLWAGSPHPATVVSPSEIHADIPVQDVWTEGPRQVTVVNPEVAGSEPATFLVGPSGVAVVSISPHQLTVDPGNQGALLGRPLATDLSPIAGRHISWSSTDQNVVRVFGDGTFRAVAPGSARIRAQTADRWSEIPVLVRELPVGSVVVGPPSAAVLVGGRVQLRATVYDASGAVVTDRPVAWSSDHPALATVDGTGLVTAHARGTVRVRAEAGGKHAYATVEVRQWPGSAVWTFDLRWPDPSQLRPSVGDTTWVDAGGTTRTAAMILTGSMMVLDRAAGRYTQRFSLRVDGLAGAVERVRTGSLGYDWSTGDLLFTPDGNGEATFTGRLTGAGEMRVTQAVGTAPHLSYLYVVR